MIAALLAAMLSGQSGCSAPAGTDALLALDRRLIVVGEMHGTTETPAAFAAMVCEASLKGQVTVALEMPLVMQPALDALLEAESNDAATTALSGTWLMDPTFNDGRTSRAMVDLLMAVREMKRQGRDVGLHAFQPNSRRSAGLSQAWSELDMAHHMARAFDRNPVAKVFVLVGNIHARKTPIERLPQIGLPAAAHLPTADIVSLYVVQQGGRAWNCQATCGPNDQGSTYTANARGVILEPYGEGAYDGVLALGPTTASPPVAASGEPSGG